MITIMNETEIIGTLHSGLSQHGVEISDTASEILTKIILAIKEDPESSWRNQGAWLRDDSDAVQRDAINGLTLKLAQLSGSRSGSRPGASRRPQRLHTYAILHYISDWIDQLCPFAKPARERKT